MAYMDDTLTYIEDMHTGKKVWRYQYMEGVPTYYRFIAKPRSVKAVTVWTYKDPHSRELSSVSTYERWSSGSICGTIEWLMENESDLDTELCDVDPLVLERLY